MVSVFHIYMCCLEIKHKQNTILDFTVTLNIVHVKFYVYAENIIEVGHNLFFFSLQGTQYATWQNFNLGSTSMTSQDI